MWIRGEVLLYRGCYHLHYLSSGLSIIFKKSSESNQFIPIQVQTLGTSLRDSQHVISRDNLTQYAPGIDRPAALICRYAEVRTKEFIAKNGRDARMPSKRYSLFCILCKDTELEIASCCSSIGVSRRRLARELVRYAIRCRVSLSRGNAKHATASSPARSVGSGRWRRVDMVSFVSPWC
jgi:hypothetical protein